jgi:[ribosomal protein S5]-alanine N-acetyltransferase
MSALELPLPDPPLTDRARGVRLRPWRDDAGDAAALAAAWNDPGVAAHNVVPQDRSPAAARRWIAGDADRRARGLSLDLVVAPVGGEEVWGEVGLRGVDRGAGRAEVGWWLAPAARGRGASSTSLALLAGWALGPPLGLRQVWARIDPGNEASARVAVAAGFRQLGVAGGSEIWART